jgi:hypothetical protein
MKHMLTTKQVLFVSFIQREVTWALINSVLSGWPTNQVEQVGKGHLAQFSASTATLPLGIGRPEYPGVHYNPPEMLHR